MRRFAALAALAAAATPAWGQTPPPPPAASPPNPAPAAAGAAPAGTASAAPAPLVLHFDEGSATVRPDDEGVLDHAARLFRDGNPIVMVVTGAADSVGSPAANLRLSEARAQAALRGLQSRGIPVGRLQLVAKGATEPAVPGPPGQAAAENRRVEISWR